MPLMKKCVTKYGIWYSDRRIKVEEIANALHISHSSVSTCSSLRDFGTQRAVSLYKLTARWVPKSLRDEQMATRASVYSALLKRFRSKEDDFLSRLVAVHETWVHFYEPENKAQSRQSAGPGSPRPKKFKTQPSAGKVMATVFCKFARLRTEICEKRRGKLSKRVLLQQDNARVHTCKIAMDAVERNGLILQANTTPCLFSGLSS